MARVEYTFTVDSLSESLSWVPSVGTLCAPCDEVQKLQDSRCDGGGLPPRFDREGLRTIMYGLSWGGYHCLVCARSRGKLRMPAWAGETLEEVTEHLSGEQHQTNAWAYRSVLRNSGIQAAEKDFGICSKMFKTAEENANPDFEQEYYRRVGAPGSVSIKPASGVFGSVPSRALVGKSAPSALPLIQDRYQPGRAS